MGSLPRSPPLALPSARPLPRARFRERLPVWVPPRQRLARARWPAPLALGALPFPVARSVSGRRHDLTDGQHGLTSISSRLGIRSAKSQRQRAQLKCNTVRHSLPRREARDDVDGHTDWGEVNLAAAAVVSREEARGV